MSWQRRLFQLLFWLGLGCAIAFGGGHLSSIATTPDWLQEGIEAYEAQRYADAIAAWTQAYNRYETQENTPNRALVQSNLALAHAHLGNWDKAQAAISQSLAAIAHHQLNPDATYWQIYAKIHNAQGQLHWLRGQMQAALQSWQTATPAYDRGGSVAGAIQSTINQAIALQGLGFSDRARTTLKSVDSLLAQQTDPHLKSIGLKQLGVAYRRVGLLQESLPLLQASLEIAPTPRVKSESWLALGNTQRALGNRDMAISQLQTAETYYSAARQSYHTAAQLSPQTALPARLNALSLAIETGQWLDTTPLIPPIERQLQALPPSRTHIFARLNFARSLTCLQQNLDSPHPLCLDRDFLERERDALKLQQNQLKLATKSEIAAIIATSFQQAQQIDDKPAQSYALGQLGELYERAGQLNEAKSLSQRALLVLEESELPEIRYRWQWQLGRILERQNDLTAARAAYATAAATLTEIRGDLRAVDAEVRFAFRDNIAPFYRQWVDVLLRPDASGTILQTNLRQALAAIDALQLAELENYLGCDLAYLSQLNRQLDPNAAILYPIILENRVVTIAEFANAPLRYREISIPRNTVEATARSLRYHLTIASATPEVLLEAQHLYDWLIAPLEPLLSQQPHLNTLVFVLDGSLRNLPMGVLYDGDRYLIEKQAIAIAPRLELFASKTPKSTSLNLLLGGVDIPQTIDGRDFEAIAHLDTELNLVAEYSDRHATLLNQQFTRSQLEQTLRSQSFNAIHWKTHGVFSSNPEATFLVAYQDTIHPRDLADLLYTSRQIHRQPLSLLVLSACETAQGDNRAVLGLAGIAVRTGARSTLSTLWRADDLATTELMNRFYHELNQPGRTTAEALRQAQLMLLERGYSDPYTWATYILVGSWL
jgi:CHAT domain-containing protein